MLDLIENKLVKKARELAELAHVGQTRWGGEPYITHPRAVASKLKEFAEKYPSPLHSWSSTADEYKVVAWLHDVVEDTDCTLGNLLDVGFPYRIVQAVDAITHREDESYATYLERVRKDCLARIVKLADITHNLETINRKKNKQRTDKYEVALNYLKDAEI